MASVDFSTVIRDLAGEPVKDGDVVLTLGAVAQTILTATFADEQNLSGPDKLARFKFALRISGATEAITVSAEEVTLLKSLIGRGYGPVIVGRSYEILDPTE